MVEIFLTYPTPEGSRELAIESGRTTFGRSSDAADYRLDDEGLSRLHASVYRDGDNVWIVDENSTNGSFVNNQKVTGSGTILKNGDSIKIGNHTKMIVKIADGKTAAHSPAKHDSAIQTNAAHAAPTINYSLLAPIFITMFALFVIGVSAIFIGVKVIGSDSEIVYKSNNEDAPEQTGDTADEDETNKNKPEKTPQPERTPATNSSVNPANLSNSPVTLNDGSTSAAPTGKKFQLMTEDEKIAMSPLNRKKSRALSAIKKRGDSAGSSSGNQKYLNGYVGRLSKARNDNCSQGGWGRSDFLSVLERAAKNSPFIVRSFNSEGVEPQIGIYIAMIESEHCPCLESTTHAKGMFQFLASSAPDYDLRPEDRCLPEPSAKAAAKYVKSLMGRFGTAPDSVPLSIASYNSGQGNLSKNIENVLAAVASQNRNFWTLAANQNKMEGGAGKQFSKENIKYVPKFFATAIIGENPQDFGVNLQPLSTYTK